MIKRSDWQAVLDELIEEERATLGEPPTVEEAGAYMRGELAPEAEERMRMRLVAYPELAQALTAPFPSEEEPRPGRVLQFWRASTALAAAVALVFGAALWRGGRREPRVLADAQQLFADGQRGGSSPPVTIDAHGEPVVLIVPVYDPGAYERYRLELTGDANRVLWRSGVLARRADDAFRFETSLEKGRYKVVLYGVEGEREQRLDTYSLRVR